MIACYYCTKCLLMYLYNDKACGITECEFLDRQSVFITELGRKIEQYVTIFKGSI